MKKVHSRRGKFLEEFSFNLKFIRFFKDILDSELVKFWKEEQESIFQEQMDSEESLNSKNEKVA